MKWIFGFIVVVALAGAAAWWFGFLEQFGFPPPSMATKQMSDTGAEQQQTQPTVQNDLPTAADNTSTSAIEQDLASIDAQLQALEGDTASVDASLTDDEQTIPQEY